MKTHIFFASLASARANRLMPGATTETRLGGAAAERSTRDRTRETLTLEYHPARFSHGAGAKADEGDENFERRVAQSDVCVFKPLFP